jgi:hypothetical protein
MIKTFGEVNRLLTDKISTNESFCLMRIDNTAGYVMDCVYNGTVPVNEFYNEYTLVEGGVYPHDLNYGLTVVQPKTMEIMFDADILGFVDISDVLRTNSVFAKQYFNRPVFFKNTCEVLDPVALLKHYRISGELPWTSVLKDKKVLVISSHSETIKYQWDKIDKIWGEDKDLIVPFELVDAIRTPYSPVWDDRQYDNCKNWEELIEITKQIIDQYDYDVLLSGVTTQSPFYVSHAKHQGKIGIQTGGTIQLFFGIKGSRWLYNSYYDEWINRAKNPYWIFPLDVDKPKFQKEYSHLESSFAYW